MLRASGIILAKDLRLRVRDRSVFVFAIVVPLGLMVLFSAILPTDDDLTVRGVVVDDDGSPTSEVFADEVIPQLVAVGLVELAPPVDDLDDALSRLEDGELDAAWHLPAGFGEQVESGGSARIEVHVQAQAPLRAEVARGIAASYAGELDRVVLAVATTTVVSGEGLTASEVDALVADVLDADELVAVRSLATASRQLDGTSYLAAGMAAFFVFFTVQWGTTGLLEERTFGTLPRLLASPIHPLAVHLGKAIGAFVIGIVSMVVLAVTAHLALGAAWGPPLGAAILIVALVIAGMGLMAFVGSFAKTGEQASNLQSIVAVVIGMLGGVFFPLPLGDGVLRHLTLIAPHGWFLQGLGDQVATGRWSSVLPAAVAIAAFGVVFGVMAGLRLRRSLRW